VFTGLNSSFLSLGLETEFAVVYKFWKLSLPLALHLTELIIPLSVVWVTMLFV